MANRNIASAVRLALIAATAASASVYVPTAAAQDKAATQETELEQVIVTGSRIRRTEAEGVLPLTSINLEDIQASGENSVSEILRNNTFNSFGSFDAQSGVSGGAQGSALVNLRGLGSERTLVLVDGRRASYAPAFAGAATNLNAIPLAGVERIEVLRDGASAIYGSDAIGGVINVITRKDFDGFSVEGFTTFPEEEGGEENGASMILGINGERGNATFTAEHYERDIVYSADRKWTATGVSVLGGPGSFQRRGAANTNWEADARCPANLGESSQFPLSGIVLSGSNEYCGYNFAAIAGETAQISRDAAQVRANYELSDDVELFGRFQFSRNDSFGRYAPAPAIFPNFVSATNPINPTIGEVDATTGYDLNLRYRFSSLGPRDTTVNDDVLELVTGLRGSVDVVGGMDWEVAAGYNSYNQTDTGRGYGLISNFQNAVKACETEGIDSPNCYNPFADDGPDNDPGAFAHTTNTDNRYEGKFVDANINFAPFDLPAGKVGFAVGAEYHQDDYRSQNDAQSDAGNVFGSAGGSSSGDRNWWSLYSEALVPIVSSLEAQVAVRYDDYSDFGDEVSPKVGLKWRPMESVLVRGSWGEGFRAPDLESLYGAPAQSFEDSVDTLACALNPADTFACETNQRETYFTSNRDLGAETSEQYSFGIVFAPTPKLSFTLDYYNITLEEAITSLTTQQVLDFEYNCFQAGVTCNPATQGSTIRDPQTGELLRAFAPVVNQANVETDGIDFDATWGFGTGIGDFTLNGAVSYVLSYEEEVIPGEGMRDVLGYVNDSQNSGTPEMRGNFGVNWSYQDVFAGVTAYYIDSFKACTAPPAGLPDSESGAGDCSRKIDSFTTIDLQLGYNLPWNGTVTIGGRNITGEEPPLDPVFGTDQYSIRLHGQGYYGAVWYARYRQDFSF